MKRDELLDFLLESDEFTKKELKKKKIEELQVLFDERFDIEYEDEDFSDDLKIQNIEEEIVEIDISKLSTVEQRQYRRAGILPQIIINKYTRFDDETPKMNN